MGRAGARNDHIFWARTPTTICKREPERECKSRGESWAGGNLDVME